MPDTSSNPSRAGRPLNINIAAEDANILRKAVKVTASYFGIRLQDLGDPSWIAAAMRKKAPLSVEHALQLLNIITHPRPGLVAKKRPQGSSAAGVMQRALQEGLGAGEHAPRDVEWLKADVAAQYVAYVNGASLIMMKYKIPMPGTAVFVLPGTARLVASMLGDILPLETLGKKHRREVVETLERYFELGENIFSTVLGKELVPRLTYASLAQSLRETARTVKAEGWKAEHLASLEEWAHDVRGSERRRRQSKSRRADSHTSENGSPGRSRS